MGIGTTRVIAILRDPDLDYQSRDARIAYRTDDPAIAVVYRVDQGFAPWDREVPMPRRMALTVVWRTQEQYTRTEHRQDGEEPT